MEINKGNGGLHGALKGVTVENCWVLDVDSFYPSIIINKGLYPKVRHPERYEDLLRLKRSGNKEVKLLLNIMYGLCPPELRQKITAYGQEVMELLINRVGGRLIQVNTDGLIVAGPDFAGADSWCRDYNFTLKRTHLQKIIQKDVNNYCALLDDGGIIKKGALYNQKGIIPEAICKHLLTGKPLEACIKEGALIDYCMWLDGDFYELGAVKYQSFGLRYCYALNGYTIIVDGAKGLNRVYPLNGELKNYHDIKIDYKRYLKEAEERLKEYV